MAHQDEHGNMAPNGRPSNLSAEDWAYVRSAAFKAWAGDWEKPDASSVVLDENGEPKLLYHGSSLAFERFDLTKGGANTGAGSYRDHVTGEDIPVDSRCCIFFTDSLHQAASYAFLGHFMETERMERALQRVSASIRSGHLAIGYKIREDFERDVRMLSDIVPSLKNLPPAISPLTQAQRDSLAKPVLKMRDIYLDGVRKMSQGGLSNQYHNCFMQERAVKSIIGDMARLRQNDLDVSNEFGTFRSYNMSVFGSSGNSEIYLFVRDGHISYLNSRDGRPVEPFDQMDDNRIEEVKAELTNTVAAGWRLFEESVASHGYDDATYIYKVFLKASKPMAHDYRGSAFPDKYKPNEKYGTGYVAARQVREARRRGCDMVIYENIRDPFDANSYGVFNTDQILIRQRQHGVLPRLDEKDAQRLRSLGASEEEIQTLQRVSVSGIAAPYAYPKAATEEKPPCLTQGLSLQWKDTGVVVGYPNGKSEFLGAVCHAAGKDRDYLQKRTAPPCDPKPEEQGRKKDSAHRKKIT